MGMTRAIVLTPQDEFIHELAPDEVYLRTRLERINGPHSLTIRTTYELKKPQRLLTQDWSGKWREWVVLGEVRSRAGRSRAVGEYYCTWSLQYDLSLTNVSRMPGVQNPVLAAVALEAALSGTARWTVGTVTRMTTGGASMYEMSGWEALGVLVDTWGGELDAEIEFGRHGVLSRRVALLEAIGSGAPTRRFDWTRDLPSTSRTVSEEPLACRIKPKGKGEETEGGGYGRKIGIESVNDGIPWLQNDETAPYVRVPDGSGGYEYPMITVENGEIDDPQKLLEWGLSVIDDYTTPNVTYNLTVTQLKQAGMDVHGLSLGDVTQCVDHGFCEEGLRVQGRAVEIQTNELDETDIKVTIGYIGGGIAGKLASLSTRLGSAAESAMASSARLDYMSTAEYVSGLIGRMNAEANAAGGYTYITEGAGIKTYDAAVSDPLVGTEATQVVEVRGGNLRIAASRTSAGDWDWRTMLQAGAIAAELVTAINAKFGYIGNPNGNIYINLDTGVIRLEPLDTLAEEVEGIKAGLTATTESLVMAIEDAKRFATDYLKYEDGALTLGATDSAIKNVMTNSRQAFRTDAGDISWYGLGDDGLWKLFIANAEVTDMLQFGGFAWIARDNGNMTIKWVGGE